MHLLDDIVTIPIKTMTMYVILVVILLVVGEIDGQNPALHRKFEYKHSFRAPNLSQRDGTIPFWTISGDAIASGEQLRLAPSMRSRRGIAWNKRQFASSDHFEVEFSVKVTGQGRIGADGLALWYTAQPGTLGPVFGSNDYWIGMGLMFDSFDNDGQKNNPFISLMINDGTRSYDHHSDGAQQILSGCQKDFRNKPYPLKIKVEYFRNVLTILVHDGMTPNVRYELCIRAENINLPKNGYFGLSAATGGLADDHDVTEFSLYSLHLEAPKHPSSSFPQEEKQKYDAEFEKQMQDYEKQRQTYKEEHPDKAKEDDADESSKYFEDATARELRQIFESQTAIHLVMQQMEQKLNNILQQQNQHTQQIENVRTGVTGQQPVGGAGHAAIAADGSGFTQGEKSETLQSLRDLIASLRDMKSYVNEIFTRTYNMELKMNQHPPAAGAGGDAQQQIQGGQVANADVTALRAYMESIQTDVRHIRTNQNTMGQGIGGGAGSCPNAACLGSTLFLGIITVQSAVLVLLLLFRRGQDKAKFY